MSDEAPTESGMGLTENIESHGLTQKLANVVMLSGQKYRTLVIDPPWRFQRQPRSVRPSYGLMSLTDIKKLPISDLTAENAHAYLWVPNALVSEGVEVLRGWGFGFKTILTWCKHQIGCGNYYRGSSEPILFGVRGKLPPLRRDVRTWFIGDRRQHSRKPDEFFRIVESVSPSPRVDIFSREKRAGWDQIGDQCSYFDTPKGDSNEREQIVKASGGSRATIGGSGNNLWNDERQTNSISEGGEAA